MATIHIDGRTLPIADAIAADDARLKAALEPFYPEIRNALLHREEQDGVMTVTVTKRAGPKGNTVAARLRDLPETIHPTLALCWSLQEQERHGSLTLLEMLRQYDTIEAAIADGQADLDLAHTTCQVLIATAPMALCICPQGF